MNENIRTAPAVFAVGDEYQIMVETTCPCLVWVDVGGESYFDGSNGIMRSKTSVHRVSIPREELDRAGAYTLCVMKMIERKAYFSTTEDAVRDEFRFYPVGKGTVRAYQIADAHNRINSPVAACRAFEKKYGKIDFLILNGDVLDSSQSAENFHNIYVIASELTGGEKPVVFSRGNHDLRGLDAENFAEYTPNRGGSTYYSFTLGDIAGIVLDCGEDKTDDHAEYGHTVCCHGFRKTETKWLEKLTAEGFGEGMKHRVVINHVPFTWTIGGPFDIETDIYTRWSELLRERFKPELMITGHMHEAFIDKYEVRGRMPAPCLVMTGSIPKNVDGKDVFVGSGFIFGDDGIKIVFSDSEGGFPESWTK